MAADATLDKTLPHNLEAERSVLGAILLDETLYNHAAEVLRSEDFYWESHRKIFARMEALSARSHAIDFITLSEELTRASEMEAIGGMAYLASLTDGVPRTTHIENYARIVKNKSMLRRLIHSANEIMSLGLDNSKDPEEILELAEKRIFEISESRVGAGFVSLSAILTGTFKSIEEVYQRKELITGLKTGFKDLDQITCGLQKSDLIIVAARPGLGKTSLALNIGQYVATKLQKVVGVFSLEMSAHQLVIRMLCSEARVDSHRLRSGFLSREDLRKLAGAVGVLSGASMFIDDSGGLSPMEMRSKARRLKLEHGLDLLIVDYIQLMGGGRHFENRQQEISAISRALKLLAKELEIPVVALSQLSRAVELRRGQNRPQLSDLRESGSLEQDADVVIFIYREEGDDPQAEILAKVEVAKQRHGPTDTISLAFMPQFTQFGDPYFEK